jgi:hypothetical protein
MISRQIFSIRSEVRVRPSEVAMSELLNAVALADQIDDSFGSEKAFKHNAAVCPN